jgi:ABC-type phosphate transport system permease subunit
LAIGVGLGLAYLTGILLDYGLLTSLRPSLEAYSSISSIIFGWLLATLVAGAVIERLVQPFTKELADIMSKEETRSLKNAGRWIGLLERTLVYGALCAGRPDAVVIVVTIKSIARFPQFKTEAFAEYYLVGTLLSLLAALTVGATVRVLLGWPAIPTS